MKHPSILAILSLALITASTPSVYADGAVAPKADAILRQMSATLGAAKQFTFVASREMDPTVAKKLGQQTKTRYEVSAQRPGKLFAHSKSPGDVRDLIADGKQLTLLDVKENLYSTVPMAASLDTLPAELSKKYGFAPPLAEFVSNNPYQSVLARTQSISYLGTASLHSGFLGLNSVKCDRIALVGAMADAELWIGVADHLPKKLTAILKGETSVGLKLTFSDWNLAASPNTQTFTFTAPSGAVKVPMMTTTEIQTALKTK